MPPTLRIRSLMALPARAVRYRAVLRRKRSIGSSRQLSRSHREAGIVKFASSESARAEVVPDSSNVLDRILTAKRDEVSSARVIRSLNEVQSDAERRGDVRDFSAAVKERLAAGRPAVIAEVKKASPSKGLLRGQFDPA